MAESGTGAVLSYVGLRRAVGAIGLALPFVLVIGELLVDGVGLRSSLSGYYHTSMRDVFVGSLCAIGVFLFCYRYERTDDRLANLAGVSAVGVALFPTRPPREATTAQIVVGYVHLTSAAVFFVCLAWFCLVLFTRSEGEPNRRKAQRNAVYRTCGVLILACLVLAVLNGLVVPEPIADGLHLLLWLESVAVLAFGVAWSVKGETLLRDVPAAVAA